MSTPSHRSRAARLSAGGPSHSVLHKLLDEINNPDANSTVFRREGPSPPSRRQSVPSSRRSSVWVKGGSAAQDARNKLRALDEARQRRQSLYLPDATYPTKLHSAQEPHLSSPTSTQVSMPTTLSSNSEFSPTFKDVTFSAASSLETEESISPGTEYPSSSSPEKRDSAPDTPPHVISKRLRTESFTDMTARERMKSLSDTGPNASTDGGDRTASFSPSAQHYNFGVQIPQARACSWARPEQPSSGRMSYFHPIEEAPGSPSPPSTPRQIRSPTNTDGGATPVATPAWMKPLHLVDDERSIFMNVHGEAWRDNPLCLYCFRQHSNFHKIQRFGCEVCGREEILTSHYWEDRPY